MTKGEPDDLEGVDTEAEDRAASLIERWQRHQGPPDPDSATVSRLDEARARRDGPAPVEPPLAEPIPLPVRQPSPEPGLTPRTEGVRRPKHAALRAFPPTERSTDSVTASREVLDALGRTTQPPEGPAGTPGPPGPPGPQGPDTTEPPAKPRSPGSRRAPRHAARPGKPKPTPAAVELTPPVARPAPVAPPTPAAPSTPWHPPSRPVAPPVAKPSSPARSAGPVGSVGSTEHEPGRSLNVEFAPKLAARRIVGVFLLVLLAATVGAAFLAYTDARPLTLGAAGTLLALTLVVYAIRAGSAPTYLAIRSGQLEVVRGKTMEKFDLTSRFTRIEVVGTPGRPGWRVLLGRFGRDPLVISGSIVDPKRFMAEMERYRPKE